MGSNAGALTEEALEMETVSSRRFHDEDQLAVFAWSSVKVSSCASHQPRRGTVGGGEDIVVSCGRCKEDGTGWENVGDLGGVLAARVGEPGSG